MSLTSTPERRRPARRWAIGALGGVFSAICLAPYHSRLKHPSLYSDDVTRVADLQVMPLQEMLVRPFNEHLAPLFEVVSAVTWRLCEGRLTAAPLGFTLASYLPFLLVLWLLGTLARRTLGSATAGLAAVAFFALSTVAFETVAWYSGSSFTWALLGTLAAWDASTRACESVGVGRRCGWLGIAALSALAAPAFSAIGLLAAPFGIVAATRPQGRPGRPWAVAVAAAPAVGAMAYLVLASICRYHDIVADSLHRNADLVTGLLSIARAPIDVLLPGLFGLREIDQRLAPLGIDTVLFIVAMAGVLAWAWASPHRPAILGGLVLILGGYSVTYCVRTNHGPHWILMVERYHLFPQLGLSMVLAAALRPWLSRFDPRPVRGLVVVIVLAGLLLATHRGEFLRKSRSYHFPDQHKTLAALEDLGALCKTYRITRPQALSALDPIRPRWFDRDDNALIMLGPTVGVSGLPDPLVRATLLSALTPDQREALCGGMDASPYLRPSVDVASVPVAVGQLVDALRVREAGSEGHYLSAGRPSYLEYRLPDPRSPDVPGARYLCIPSAARKKGMEVWWSDSADAWSETRSVRWQPDPTRPPQPWAIALERLPHWDPAGARYVRLFFRAKGPVAVGAPVLLR